MLNRYPLWKYLILLVVFFVSFLYALPNLYGEDPAIQITGIRGAVVNEQTVEQIFNILKKKKIESKLITLENNIVLARFANLDMQLHAYEALVSSLKEQYTIALNLVSATPYWLKILGAEPIKLGLELRGGIYFLIKVDMEMVLDKLRKQNITGICSDLHKKGIPFSVIQKINNYGIEICFRNDKNIDLLQEQAKSFLIPRYQDLVFTSYNKNILRAEITDKHICEIRDYTILQNINIIRNRINQLGITETLVQRQGTDCIVVLLPGIQDMARAKEIFSTTATLEFRLVNIDINASDNQLGYLPDDSEIKYMQNGEPIVLYKQAILTGDHIIDSTSDTDDMGNPQVSISLDNIGGSIMYDFTRKNQDKWMATLFIEYKDSGQKDSNGHIILRKDEKIINVAKISTYFGSKFRIAGISNLTEARQLSLFLRAGALIAPIQIVEERMIGPTLGLQNIEQGVKASLASLLASMLFMITYYRKFGLIASLSLITNLILIIGILSLLPGVILTMSGIAGIVLTFAVAVDANVLINERIKEELKNGRSVQQAIHEGYKGAFSSILDANLTTIIIAIILYVIGTSSIKGFAITTIIGVVTSMFTTILGTRAIVNLLYGGKFIKKLSI